MKLVCGCEINKDEPGEWGIVKPCTSHSLAAANAEREELIGALEMMWDQYENGTQCYEDPDEHAGYLGHAVNLSADEEQRVLALIPAQCSAAIDAAIAARKP